MLKVDIDSLIEKFDNCLQMGELDLLCNNLMYFLKVKRKFKSYNSKSKANFEFN